MNKTNIIIEKLKNIQKELEDVKDIDNNNNIIINEIDILINNINDTIDNIENSINDTRNKIKENIIYKIFMPYIIYLSFIIKDDDIEQLLNVDNSFNESFFKEVLKKYIK
jgi:hypothetical protein